MDLINLEDGDIRCEAMHKLKVEKKYKEAVDHLLNGCILCITNPKKKFGGREMLFPHAPPPWIKIPEEEKKNPVSWEKYKVQKGKTILTADEIDSFLEEQMKTCGDEKMVHMITTYKKVSRNEGWKILRQLRKKRIEQENQAKKEEREEDRKKLAEQREAERLKKADEKRHNEDVKREKKNQLNELMNTLNEEEKALQESFGDSASKGPSTSTSDDVLDAPDVPNSKKDTVFNIKAKMPWCPNRFDIICVDERSVLDHESQRRISAMCQNLMFHGTFQRTANKREFKDLMVAAESEYDVLAEAAKVWASKQTVFPLDAIDPRYVKCSLDIWKRRAPAKKTYLFNSILFSIDTKVDEELTASNEATAMKPVFVGYLQKGDADILNLPDMTKKCELGKTSLINLPPTKLPITVDPAAHSLLISNPTVSIVMDATTACNLMTPCWESQTFGLSIPITVTEEYSEGKLRKTIVLSKPIPSNSTTIATIQRKSAKRALRRHFVELNQKHKAGSWKSLLKDLHNSTTDEAVEEKDEGERVKESTSSESVEDPLGSIFADIEKMKTNFTAQAKKMTEAGKKVDTGYQYSIFRVGTIDFLVRSRPPFVVADGDNKKGVHPIVKNKTVSFEPRIEYLPNAGAMELGREEWMWNYLKKTFKTSSAHLLFRTHYKLENVLQVDAISMDSSNPSAVPPGAFSLLSARSMIFEQFLKELTKLEPGEYLAYQENNKPMRVVPCTSEETSAGVSGVVTTDALRILDKQCETLAKSNKQYFYGFSPDVLFQWQIVQGRAPRTLLAADSPLVEHLPQKSNLNKVEQKRKSLKRKFYDKQHSNAKRNHQFDLDDPNLSIDFTNPSMVSMNRSYQSVPPPNQSNNFRGNSGYRGHRGGRGNKRGRGRGRGRREFGNNGPRGGERGSGGGQEGGAASSSSSAQ